MGIISKRLLRRCVLSELSEDLLVEVLLRLPFKSFIQFHCVCKRWYALISTLMCVFKRPWAFAYLTPQLCLQDDQMRKLEFLALSGGHHNYENPPFITDLPFLPRDLQQQHPWLTIQGSFNDLILCRGRFSKCSNTYYICNPLTNQYIVLPPVALCDDHNICCSSLICEAYTKNDDFQHARLGSDLRFWVVVATTCMDIFPWITMSLDWKYTLPKLACGVNTFCPVQLQVG